MDYLFSITGFKKWMITIEGSWLKLLFIFGQVILQLVMMLFYFSLFKYFFLIIGSPLFAFLSEKTQAIMEGRDYPFSFTQLSKDMLRAVKLACRNALWQTVYTLSILILSFIPLIGWFTPLIALLVECYYLGFAMIDYSCERNNLLPHQSITFISKHRGLAIGNGIVFYLMHLVPVVGWVFAPGYSVIAATLSLFKAKQL
jgi:CysZ protein